MFIGKYFSKKQELEPTEDISFLKVEFLTQEEKVKKDIALQKVSKMYQDIEDQDVIINKDSMYKVSYRNTFSFKNKTKIKVGELLQLFKNAKEYAEVLEFMNGQVDTIQLIMYRFKAIQTDDTVFLMDIQDRLQNDETKVLEIVYKRKGLLSRIAVGAKKAILSLPRLIFNFILSLVKVVLSAMGMGSFYGVGFRVAKSFVGTKTILTSLLTIISIFFPMLAPIITISKLT